MRPACSIVKTENEDGKVFLDKLEKLKVNLKLNGTGEKLRKYKYLTKEEIENNSSFHFLFDFLNFMKKDDEMKEMYDCLKLKKVFIGNFGRKTGFVIRPIEENYFRIMIHIGDPEIYYLDSNRIKDSPLVLNDGYGYVVSPQESPTTSFTVYEDPIRFVYDQKIQNQIPKIRPKNYSRMTLVYDYEYEIPESYLKSLDEMDDEMEVEENKDEMEVEENKDEMEVEENKDEMEVEENKDEDEDE